MLIKYLTLNDKLIDRINDTHNVQYLNFGKTNPIGRLQQPASEAGRAGCSNPVAVTVSDLVARD